MRPELIEKMTEVQQEEFQNLKKGMEPDQQQFMDELFTLALESKDDERRVNDFKQMMRELEVEGNGTPLGYKTNVAIKFATELNMGREAYYASIMGDDGASLPAQNDGLSDDEEVVASSEKKQKVRDSREVNNPLLAQQITDSVLEVAHSEHLLDDRAAREFALKIINKLTEKGIIPEGVTTSPSGSQLQNVGIEVGASKG